MGKRSDSSNVRRSRFEKKGGKRRKKKGKTARVDFIERSGNKEKGGRTTVTCFSTSIPFSSLNIDTTFPFSAPTR